MYIHVVVFVHNDIQYIMHMENHPLENTCNRIKDHHSVAKCSRE